MKRWSSLLSLLCLLALLAVMAPAAAAAAPGAAAPAQPLQQQALDNSQDWARVRDAGKIVVGTSADYEPFEFYNSNFALDGFDIALMKELGKRMGVEVEFKDFAFDGLLNALELGQVDAAISAISVTPERQQKVDFSNLYYVGDDVALVTSTFTGTVTGTITSAADLAGLRVGVERGTTYEAWVQQNVVDAGLSNQENLVAYGDTSQMIRDLRNGTVDVVLMGSLPARQFQRRFPELKIGGQSLSSQELAVAARKGSSLVPQLNKALLAVQSDGTFAGLVEQYLQVEPKDVTPKGDDAAVDNANPPTPVPTETPAAKQPEATPVPPAPPCIDGMAFITDLNYDDYNMTAPPVMSPGQAFVKSWRVQNTGTCTWTPDYAIAYVNGNRPEARMGGGVAPIGRTVQPGELLDMSVSLVAPQTYGTFQGFWQMRNPAGTDFGQVMWVGIQVPDPNPPPPPPPPPGPPAPPAPPPPSGGQPNLRADSNYLTYGQCTTIRWDVDGVQAVYFIDGGNQIGVGGHDSRNVCPNTNTTYYLRVIQTNGASTDYPITINVTGGGGGYYIDFWADQREINRGTCTTLRWETSGVQAVYLDDKGVVGVGTKQVCPDKSKTYKLKVVRQDGGVETKEIKIKVY
ncbi:MAG: transporter substrate-binding domain-containing protein [Caldilineaceae bacterium]